MWWAPFPASSGILPFTPAPQCGLAGPLPDSVGVVILGEQTMHAAFGILEELVFGLCSRFAALFASMFVRGKVQPEEWVITAWMFVRFSFLLVCRV